MDLIDRYKKWKAQRSEESETESENSDSYVSAYPMFLREITQSRISHGGIEINSFAISNVFVAKTWLI